MQHTCTEVLLPLYAFLLMQYSCMHTLLPVNTFLFTSAGTDRDNTTDVEAEQMRASLVTCENLPVDISWHRKRQRWLAWGDR